MNAEHQAEEEECQEVDVKEQLVCVYWQTDSTRSSVIWIIQKDKKSSGWKNDFDEDLFYWDLVDYNEDYLMPRV